MAIIKTIDEHEFVQAFDDYNRSDNFTIAARRALFDYYEDYSDSTGQPFELDVIAICCDWSELSEDEIRTDYDLSPEELEEQTTVIPVERTKTYLVVSF